MDENISTSNTDNKIIRIQSDYGNDENDHHDLAKSSLLKKNRSFGLSSLILPILLILLLILGSVLLTLTLFRLNICRLQHLEQTEALAGYQSDTNLKTWMRCIKTDLSSCVCPATFVHSTVNPFHCMPYHSRCLKSCKHNLHCKCHNLIDPVHCRNITQNWIENELEVGPIENFHNPVKNHLLQSTWMDNFNHQLEHSVTNFNSDERLFLSPNRRDGITIHTESHDFLFNERWVKVEINTTRQHIVYTQVDPQMHTCRMSSLYDDGSVKHGAIHKCPSSSIVAPYFFGIACHDILVLWKGIEQSPMQLLEPWGRVRHNFESTIPYLPVLLDPFHRYYSLYPDSKIEIKDLNGDLLGEFFTDIEQATRFEFIDPHGTLWIANSTHMQSFRSINNQIWLDF